MSTTTQPRVTQKPRWWRRGWIAFAAIASVLTVPVGWMTISYFTTQSDWDAAVAEAEKDLSRWRLLEMEADREVLPEVENSGLHIIATNRVRGRMSVYAAPDYEKIFDNLPPTAQLNTQQAKLIRDEMAKMPNAVIMARQLKDKSRGRFPIKYSDDAISTLIKEHQEARGIGDLLHHDAMLRAHDEKYDEAVESCLALLNVGRSMEGELTLIAFLIRVAMHHRTIDALERTLAQGQASEKSLKILQEALVHESRQDHWLQAMRGERAFVNHLFDNVRSGKVKASGFAALRGMGGGKGNVPSISDWLQDQFPSSVLRHYPEFLAYLNRSVETAKLPIHQRHANFQASDAEARNSKNILIGLFAPAFSKVHFAECRSQAVLRSAAVALACERYRLAHKNKEWPASLEVLVNEKLLDAAPLDPFDGQPLRFRRIKDGVVIYSVGFDRLDNQGNINRERDMETGVDIGFRLWDVGHRRQAPRPIFVPPEDNP